MTSNYNLPSQLTTFVGREDEIAEISRLLTGKRLITMMGTGGSGKTRLALQVASLLKEQYDGVWFVQLDTISDPSLVPQVVASTIGIREETGPARNLVSAIASFLGDKRALLVLDNCEHVVDACASLVDTLLRSCPHLQVLATSRQALGVEGELTWAVPPLSMPDDAQGRASLDDITGYDAVQLFVNRAAQSRPGFTLTESNAPAVVLLCRQLDGLPLALELAAARVKVLSVAQIVERLGERFRLFIAPGQMVLPRQQTLLALMDWSYDLLSEPEKRLLRSLSVFAGSFSLEAVLSTCGDQLDEYELIDLLAHLSDKSLIIMEERDRQARYRLLETIRQYAANKLRDAGEMDEVRKRHRDWYMALAEEAGPELMGDEQAEWLKRLELEHDNLRAALDWSVKGEKNAEAALLLAGLIWRFWDMHGYLTEGRKRLEDSLSAPGEVSPLVRARALSGAGNLAIDQGDFASAMRLHGEALELRRQVDDLRGIGASLSNLGVVARSQGDYERAAHLYEESLAIFRKLGNNASTAGVLVNLGFVAQSRGDYEHAEQLFTEAMHLSSSIGDTLGVAIALNNLGEVAQSREDYARAKEFYNQALEIAEELGDKLGIVGLVNNLASLAHYEGDRAAAVQLYRQSLLMSKDLGHLPGIAECLEGLAVEEAALDNIKGARLFGAAMQLRERIGAPVAPNERAEYDKQVELMRTHLGSTFGAAVEAGKALSLDAAIALALEDAPPPDRLGEEQPPGGQPSAVPDGWKLTKRELEVLRLVASGCTDAEVADTLNINTRTVGAHLQSIYGKLEVHSRSAASRKAADFGLV